MEIFNIIASFTEYIQKLRFNRIKGFLDFSLGNLKAFKVCFIKLFRILKQSLITVLFNIFNYIGYDICNIKLVVSSGKNLRI